MSELAIVLGITIPIAMGLTAIWYKLGRLDNTINNGLCDKISAIEEWINEQKKERVLRAEGLKTRKGEKDET